MAGKSGRRTGEAPLRRRVGVRRPKKTFVLFCEGTRTEPEYLRALKLLPSVREVASVDLRVESKHQDSDIYALVEMAVEARDKSLGEEGEIDEFWCVFDVEWPVNHPKLKEAIELAKRNDVNLAVSNPCFEIWLILHYRDHNAWMTSENARKDRARLDGSTDKGVDFTKYETFIPGAIRRAVLLDQRHERDGTDFPDNNPSSGMHLLMRAIPFTN